MKLQTQAVLRRMDADAPLELAGVLVAGSFYPNRAQDAWGPLHLEVGLIALAPLTPVIADSGDAAAEQAIGEAREQWSSPSLVRAEVLAWQPIADVRARPVGEDIAELIEQMTAANTERSAGTPSTPPYHAAARELERLAGLVYEATSAGERIAEDGALRAADAVDEVQPPNGDGTLSVAAAARAHALAADGTSLGAIANDSAEQAHGDGTRPLTAIDGAYPSNGDGALFADEPDAARPRDGDG